MPNYENSVIYKLCCKDPSVTDEYVGSTVNFTRRKCEHKTKCCNENSREYNLKVYQTIRKNGGWVNWDMVEVERYCAKDRKDLHSRERFWFEQLGATLNVSVPTRSMKEWRESNKEKIAKKKAKYRENNKEKIAEYYENNKEKIAEYQAEYRENNKETIAEKRKIYKENNKEKIAEYYENNKEQIAKKRSEKVECECGCVVTRQNLRMHKKTPKHRKLMEQKTT